MVTEINAYPIEALNQLAFHLEPTKFNGLRASLTAEELKQCYWTDSTIRDLSHSEYFSYSM